MALLNRTNTFKTSHQIVPVDLSRIRWKHGLLVQELDNVEEELEKIALVKLLQHRSIISLIGNVQRSSLILEKVLHLHTHFSRDYWTRFYFLCHSFPNFFGPPLLFKWSTNSVAGIPCSSDKRRQRPNDLTRGIQGLFDIIHFITRICNSLFLAVQW